MVRGLGAAMPLPPTAGGQRRLLLAPLLILGVAVSSLDAVQLVRGLAFKAENVKKAGAGGDAGAKKKKGGLNEADEKNPRLQQIIAMLTPPAERDLGESPEEEAEARRRREEYEYHRRGAHHAWVKDMTTKFKLQKAAFAALPKELQNRALAPDYTPFPPNRAFYFDTPPEAYRK